MEQPQDIADGVPLVYDELRRLAAQYLRHERQGHTLQPSALVHEAYLRIAQLKHLQWRGRAEFFGVAANVMRRILVSHGRRRRALKRVAPRMGVAVGAGQKSHTADVLTIDQLLTRLESTNPEASRALELRFFGGLTDEEACEFLKVSRATFYRHLAFGKAWMYQALAG